MTSFMWNVQNEQGQRADQRLPRASGEPGGSGNGAWLLIHLGFLLRCWKCPKLDHGDSCTTQWIC